MGNNFEKRIRSIYQDRNNENRGNGREGNEKASTLKMKKLDDCTSSLLM